MPKHPFPELLSPAGSLEKLKFALAYGADAVYAGLDNFSLREKAQNFSLQELAQGLELAHGMGKKLYLAANMFYHNPDIEALKETLPELSKLPLDGMIVSDLGAISLLREKYPHIPVHISTQANTTNKEAARFYEKMGISRIVLARELSLPEIREIRDAVSLELETFIHGAMCIAYSGRCLLSNYFTNPAIYGKDEDNRARREMKPRDANAGDCAQSCRWSYQLVETTRPNDPLPVEEDSRGTTIMSSRDLNLSASLGELIEAGIDSFKIEGRMKSVSYVATVTSVYRHTLDRISRKQQPDPAVLYELEKVSHRVYTTGFYFGENQALSATPDNAYVREFVFYGVVLEVLGPKRVSVLAKNKITNDAPLAYLCPGGTSGELKKYRLIDQHGEKPFVQINSTFILEWDDNVELPGYTILRREGN